MLDDELDQAVVLQGRITAFVRAFGLHQPDRTPCGTPVPSSEAHAVGELDRDGPLTQTALGERLRLEKSTVSRIVSQLTSRGWVCRVGRGGDGRLVWLELTPEGRRAAGELAVARAARFADLLRNIPAEQRPAVIDALTTLVDAAGGQPAAAEAPGAACD
ncbi:MarR family winged helix-turn-helix transcriptional regulator [Actinoplanes xinjiangensis]|uniref:MarR family winged helix-turn-helix transcriptional regulator n=1 Tax=Actinoplanes xinjiangensis TaxID=512350 RepID=UPI00342CF3DD